MPQPKCRRRILDDEGTETEWTVLEIKCPHCRKLVRLHCGPDGIEASIYERKKATEGMAAEIASATEQGKKVIFKETEGM